MKKFVYSLVLSLFFIFFLALDAGDFHSEEDKEIYKKFVNSMVQVIDMVLQDAYENGVAHLTEKERQLVINSVIADSEIKSVVTTLLKKKYKLQDIIRIVSENSETVDSVKKMTALPFFVSLGLVSFLNVCQEKSGSKLKNILHSSLGVSSLLLFACYSFELYFSSKKRFLTDYSQSLVLEEESKVNTTLINKIVEVIYAVLDSKKKDTFTR